MLLPTEEHLFIVTASNPDAKEHIENLIAHPIDPALCARHFDRTLLDDVIRSSSDGQFYAWGAVPGPRNEPYWNAMKLGDHVLVYQDGRYTYWTRCKTELLSG